MSQITATADGPSAGAGVRQRGGAAPGGGLPSAHLPRLCHLWIPYLRDLRMETV
jgi:hypothetical protein